MKKFFTGCYSLLSVVIFLVFSVSAVAQVQETKLISKSISPLGEITLVSEMEDGHQFILKFPSLEKRLEGETYFHHSDFPNAYGKNLPNGSMKLLVALPDGSIMEMGAINCDDFYTCLCGDNPIISDSLCGPDGNGSVETCAGGGAAPYKRTYTTVPGGEVVSGPAYDNWDLANLNAGTYLQTVESADGCVVEMQFTIPDAAVGCCDGILITEQIVSDDCPSRSYIFSLNGDYGDVTWNVAGPLTNFSSSDETLEVNFPSEGGAFTISASTSYGCEVQTTVTLPDCCADMEIQLTDLTECPVKTAATLNGFYGSVTWQLRDANGALVSSHSGESWEVEFPLEGGDFQLSATTDWGCEASVVVSDIEDCRCYGTQLTYDGQVADTLRFEICDTASVKELLVNLSTIGGDDVVWTAGPDHDQSFGSAWSGRLGIGTYVVSVAKACEVPCFDKVVLVVEEVECCIENLQICGLCGTQDSVELQQGILLDTIVHPAICPGDSVWIDNCVFWDASCYQTPAMLDWSITYLGEMGEVSLPVGENFEAWAFQIGYYQVSVTDGVTTAIKIHYIPLKDGCDSLGGGDVQTSAFRMVAGGTNATTETAMSPVSLYPNPTTGRVQIESAHQIIRYILVDATGRTVQEGAFPPSGEIDLGEGAPPGVYYLRLTGDNGDILSKQVVKIQ